MPECLDLSPNKQGDEFALFVSGKRRILRRPDGATGELLFSVDREVSLSPYTSTLRTITNILSQLHILFNIQQFSPD